MKKALILSLLGLTAMTTFGCEENAFHDRSTETSVTHHPIFNGTPDTSDAHKAVVGLYVSNNPTRKSCDDNEVVFCTGTLIASRYVLTAAHCVSKNLSKNLALKPIIVDDPCNQFLKICVGPNEKNCTSMLDIEKITYHEKHSEYFENFDPYYYTLTNDIALIKLKKAVDTSVAKPIPALPPWLGITHEEASSGKLMAEFVGYGYTETGSIGTKLTINTPIALYCGSEDLQDGCKTDIIWSVKGCHPNPQTCKESGSFSYDEAIMLPYGAFYYSQVEGGPCNGDSGGPAFIKRNGQEYLAGITSFGDEACKYYGLSTAVQDHFEWLIQQAPELVDDYGDICKDKVDNDNDGKIDCEDETCKGSRFCEQDEPDIKPDSDDDPSTQTHETKCNDGNDDDGDGKIDCDDQDCADYAVCNKSSSKNKDSCDATTRRSSQNSAILTLLLGLLALLGLARRTSNHHAF